MAIRKASLMKRSALLGVIWAVIALYGAVFVGLLARGLLTTAPADPERVMPLLAIQILPAWLAGVMIAAAMAAMMSTADSQLLVASSSVVQDFYHKTFRREPSARTLVLLSRIVTLAIGVVAMVVALGQDPDNPVGVVFWLVLYAWGGLAASVDGAGKLGWVQGVGRGPALVELEHAEPYGAGALLLAGSEMLKLEASRGEQ